MLGLKLIHVSKMTQSVTSIWWRHQIETFSALLVLCAGNSPITGEFPSQRPVTRSFDVFFDLHLNKRLSKQSRGWWYGTQSCPLWRQCNEPSTLSVITVSDVFFGRWPQSFASANLETERMVSFSRHDMLSTWGVRLGDLLSTYLATRRLV